MTDPSKTLVTIATYNEIENLPALVEAIWAAAPDVDILVIDDNSPDGTGAWCDERAASDPRLRCLHRAGKLGLGTATIAGMQYAIGHGYQYLLNLDADFSHDPRYIPALRGCMEPQQGEPVDVAVGSRYVPGGGIVGWPPLRHFMSWGVNVYARWLLGLRVRDTSGAFRCYRVDRLAELDFSSFWSRGYSFQEELLWRLKLTGCRMTETPIVFVDRVRGSSKINGREALRALWIILALGMQNLFVRAPNPKRGVMAERSDSVMTR